MVFGKKHVKNIKGMIGVGVLSGVGAIAIEKAGGSPAAITTASGYYPLVGTAIGAGMAMDAMKGLKPKKKSKMFGGI